MKRIGNLYQEIISINNLKLADKIARRGKSEQPAVKEHDQNREANITALHESLKNKIYRTSQYKIFIIREPKERVISRLPYYPDRIVHHAVMNKMEKIFVDSFTSDTYSCIKGRGIHKALRAVKEALRDRKNTQYCLKIDVRKFYPSIDHGILKQLLRKKIKDKDLLQLLDEIIDSADGLPIGNYLSQYFANFYLTYFDHWLKRVRRCAHYFRYADDMVILAATKNELHGMLQDIRTYLQSNLNLQVKDNYQVFPVEARGIDFVGYVIRHSHIRIRKSIKQNFAHAVARHGDRATIEAYKGWASHADAKHLLKKLLNEVQ